MNWKFIAAVVVMAIFLELFIYWYETHQIVYHDGVLTIRAIECLLEA